MKTCSKIVICIFILLLVKPPAKAQEENSGYRDRICIGLGGENGYLGIDYSRDIYRSNVSLGLGCGLGTGWTGYVAYEPVNWKGLGPFISAGLSHTLRGTLILSPAASVLFGSAGLSYVPELRWEVVPCLKIGLTRYALLNGDAEGGMNGWGPLIKLGIAFPRGEK